MGRLYRFADARFDSRDGTLSVDGRHRTLRPRTAALLEHLLRHAGDLVTKEELLRAVWGDLVVTENSLAQCVKEIRRELGDTDEALLRTAHRRGYVLAAGVQEMPATAVLVAHPLSLIVLPLANIGDDSNHDYFAEGLTEDLTLDLGRMPGAFVIARGTALSYAGRAVDPRDIGRELGVRYVVEGSVRRGTDEIVITLRVSATDDARQVWADRFCAPREHLLELQRSMAGRIAHMLHLELADLPSRGAPDAFAAQAQAYDLAMQAFSLKVRSAPAIVPQADALLERALAIDPGCAHAWAVQADAKIMRLVTRNFTNWKRDTAEAETSARRALELEPEHRTAHTALGSALALQGRFEEALGCLERQMALNPNHASAHNWVGIVHTLMGNPKLALGPLRIAVDLSPRDSRLSTWIRSIALARMHDGDDAQALIDAERSVQLPRPWPRSYETLAMASALNGLMEEARAAVDVLRRNWPRYSIAQHEAEMISSRPAFLAQRTRLLDALRRAGLPETA